MSAHNQDNPYKICQTLQRGLELLQCFNEMSYTSGRISELSKATGLHRTTVKRLLETLRLSGYVEYDCVTGLYSLTYHVKSLSRGYRDSVEVVEIAWPILKQTSQQIIWPCSILTFDNGEMVVRDSTRAYSHLSFHSPLPGRRMPLLETAAGRAFIAFVSQQERQIILQLLQDQSKKYTELIRQDESIDKMINQIRRQGYAVNTGDWDDEPRFGAIALPIIKCGQVIACINCIYLLRAVKELNNFDILVKAMREAQIKIYQLLEKNI